MGLAIFDGDKMVGKLTGYESRLLSIAKGIFKKGNFTIQDPERPDMIIPIDTRLKEKPKLDIRFEGMQPIIHLKVELEGDILAIQSRINYEDPKMQPIIEKAFEQFIKTGLDRTIKKTQDLNCDVFKFGQTAVRHFGTIQEWEKYEWNKHYKEAEITTEVKFTIRRTGTQIYNSPIIFSEEKDK
jgi:spore germination protein KC